MNKIEHIYIVVVKYEDNKYPNEFTEVVRWFFWNKEDAQNYCDQWNPEDYNLNSTHAEVREVDNSSYRFDKEFCNRGRV